MKNFEWKNLIFWTLLFLGTFFLVRSCGMCMESLPTEFEYLFMKRTNYINNHKIPASSKQRDKWQQDYEFHMFNAKRTYEDAKNKCWFLPNISDREKARYCYNAAFTQIGSSSPCTKLVLAISSLALQYGLDCMDEWDYIKEKLHWSQYHFEMCDHYAILLKNS